jgi:TPP-dependent pyruvate/acetoin dehydrogenase alpha subunit
VTRWEIHGARLIEAGAATPASLERIRAEVDDSVALAVQAASAAPEPGVGAMFRHVHADSHSM